MSACQAGLFVCVLSKMGNADRRPAVPFRCGISEAVPQVLNQSVVLCEVNAPSVVGSVLPMKRQTFRVLS